MYWSLNIKKGELIFVIYSQYIFILYYDFEDFAMRIVFCHFIINVIASRIVFYHISYR